MKSPAIRLRSAAIAVASALILTAHVSPAVASAKAGGASSAALDAIRIDNFARVNDTYYRGAQPVGRDYADLAALGVKTVINLTSDDALAEEPGLVEKAGMKYVSIPMTTRTVPTQEQLDRFLHIVNDPASQPVYVHCVGGKHRTGVMTAVYRMTQQSWTADQAFDEMKHYKFGASMLHPEFKKFVYAYQALKRQLLPQASVVAASVAGYGVP